MDPVVERKFKNLRTRLDQLGFRQPLGIESVPLVERLFSDLVHTTESLKNYKTAEAGRSTGHNDGGGDGGGGGSGTARQLEGFVEAYKADNAKLVKEVNQLHLELVRRKDVMDAEVKKVKSLLRKVEHENADLRFLNTQYAHKLRVQEGEGAAKDERIQRLLEKNLEAVVETADGSKQRIATRKQRMQIKSLVPPVAYGSAQQEHGAAPPPTQRHFDLLKMADARIHKLEVECKGLKDDKAAVGTQLQTLQAQVQRREDEIERLGRLLEGGRPAASVRADGETKREERRLAQLGNQVDFLQQTNKALEQELTTATAGNEELALKVAELQSKNTAVVRELEEFDRLSRELQQEKVAAQTESQRELRKERELLRRQKSQLQKRMTEAEGLKHERLKLVGENRHLVAQLTQSEREVERLQAELDRALEDVRYSGIATGSDSGEGTKLLQQKYDALNTAYRDLQNIYNNVQRERSFYKQEFEKFSKISGGKPAPPPGPPAEVAAAVGEARRFQQEVVLLSKTVQRLELQLVDSQAEVATMRTEREQLLPHAATTPGDGAPPQSPQRHQQVALLETDNERLRSELMAIRDFALNSAADLEKLNRESSAKLKRAEQRAEIAEKLLDQARALQSQGGAGEAENADAVADSRVVEESSGEGATLQPGAIAAPSSSSVDGERGQKLSVADLQATLHELDAQRDSLQAELDDRAEAHRELEHRFEELRQNVDEKDEIAGQLRDAIANMQDNLDNRDAEINSLKRELITKAADVAAAEDKLKVAYGKITRLNADLDNMTRENQAVHLELAEAQEQQMADATKLQELTEKVRFSEGMLEVKENDRAELYAVYQSLSTEAATLESHAAGAVEANTAVRTQLAAEASKSQKLQSEVEALSLEVVAGQDRQKEMEDQTSELLAELQTAQQGHRETRDRLDEAHREVEAARGLAQIAADARDSAEARVADLSDQLHNLQREAQGTGAEALARAQQVDAAQMEAADLQQQLEELRTQLFNQESTLNRTEAENMALKRSVDDLMGRIETLNTQVQTLHVHKKEADDRADQLERELTDVRYQAAASRMPTHLGLGDSGLAHSQAPDRGGPEGE